MRECFTEIGDAVRSGFALRHSKKSLCVFYEAALSVNAIPLTASCTICISFDGIYPFAIYCSYKTGMALAIPVIQDDNITE